MDKNNRVRKIVKAPLFNRTFGAVIDLVLTIFVGAGIFLGIFKIAEIWQVLHSNRISMQRADARRYGHQ